MPTCHYCWGLLQHVIAHSNKTSCPLLKALSSQKCGDCSGPGPCVSKECLAPTYSLCAIAEILQAPTPKTIEDSAKLLSAAAEKYKLTVGLHDMGTMALSDRTIYIPAFLAAFPKDCLFFVVKGIDKPGLFFDLTPIANKLSINSSVHSHNSLEAAVRALFSLPAKEDKAQEKPSEKDAEENGGTGDSGSSININAKLDSLVAAISAQQKAIEDLRAAKPAPSSIKDIRATDKSFLDFLKTIDPITGLEKDSESTARSFLGSQDIANPPTSTSGELLSKPFCVKEFARGGKGEKSNAISIIDGKLVATSSRKRKIRDFDDWLEANLRIMESMAKDPAGAGSMLPGYSAYVARISAYKVHYNWENVYLYDKEYRKVRQDNNLPWNWAIPNLVELLHRPIDKLKDRKKRKSFEGGSTKSPSGGSSGNQRGSTSGKGHCFDFNDSRCKRGNKCAYKHICRFCKKANTPASKCPCDEAKTWREKKSGSSSSH
jgi:hypothetical protein